MTRVKYGKTEIKERINKRTKEGKKCTKEK